MCKRQNFSELLPVQAALVIVVPPKASGLRFGQFTVVVAPEDTSQRNLPLCLALDGLRF